MARKKISQYDARRYKRELEELRNKRRSDRSTWGAVPLVDVAISDSYSRGILRSAQLMGHPLVCRMAADNSTLEIFGVK
jgi:hypothetical protein